MRKTIILLAVALVPLAACEMLEGFSLPGRPGPGRSSEGGREAPDTTGAAQTSPRTDTTIWYCGVQVPDGYDWQRDTAMGNIDANILVFRNHRQTLSIQAGEKSGVGIYPDTHHLIGGHLYAEYSTATQTIISRDGRECFRYDGKESLLGILVRDKKIITLGRNQSNGTITLRENGEKLFVAANIKVFGGFGQNAPALYEYAGHYIFSYLDGANIFSVIDGTVKAERGLAYAYSTMDFRYMHGMRFMVFQKGDSVYAANDDGIKELFPAISVSNFCLKEFRNEVFACGDAIGISASLSMALSVQDSMKSYFEGSNLFLYPCGFKFIAVSSRQPFVVQEGVSGPTKAAKVLFRGDDCFFFSESCGAVCGEEAFLAISRTNKKPLLWRSGGKSEEININGYLTGVEVQVSQSN